MLVAVDASEQVQRVLRGACLPRPPCHGIVPAVHSPRERVRGAFHGVGTRIPLDFAVRGGPFAVDSIPGFVHTPRDV